MAILIADLAYLLTLGCYLGAFLLAAEFVVHSLPGSSLNSIRRLLFLISSPFLRWNDLWLSPRWGNFYFRGLLMAAFFLLIGKYGVPWLVLFSFSLRG